MRSGLARNHQPLNWITAALRVAATQFNIPVATSPAW